MPVGSALSSFLYKYHQIQLIRLENQTELSDFLLLPVLRLFCLHTEPTHHTSSVPYNNHFTDIRYRGNSMGLFGRVPAHHTQLPTINIWRERPVDP